jgi:hypothetical protein
MLTVLFRFLYTRSFLVCVEMEKLFPNVRAVVYLTAPPRDFFAPAPGAEDAASSAAQIQLHRPVRSDTLASLLRYPVNVEMSSASEYQPIRNLWGISLEGNGAVVGGHPLRDESLTRNLSRTCAINLYQCNRHEAMGESLREISRFAPVASSRRKGGPNYPAFRFMVSSGLDLDTCLNEVSV